MQQLTDWETTQNEARDALRTDIFAQLGAVQRLIKDIRQKFSEEKDAHALASVLTGDHVPITNSDSRLNDVKHLLQALAQAFETLRERSNNEFEVLQEEATDAARKAYTALRDGKAVLTGKKSNAIGTEEQKVQQIIAKHKNINLQVSEQARQEAVWELQELNETFIEEIEELRITHKVVVDGASDNWGWPDEDHQLFLKLEKEFSARASNAERLRHRFRCWPSQP